MNLSTRVPACYYCEAKAVTACRECDVDLSTLLKDRPSVSLSKSPGNEAGIEQEPITPKDKNPT